MQGASKDYTDLDAHLTNTCRLRPRPNPETSSSEDDDDEDEDDGEDAASVDLPNQNGSDELKASQQQGAEPQLQPEGTEGVRA